MDRYGNAKTDWFRTILQFKNGVSSHKALGRGFGRLDAVEFCAAMQNWTNEIAGCLRAKLLLSRAIDAGSLAMPSHV